MKQLLLAVTLMMSTIASANPTVVNLDEHPYGYYLIADTPCISGQAAVFAKRVGSDDVYSFDFYSNQWVAGFQINSGYQSFCGGEYITTLNDDEVPMGQYVVTPMIFNDGGLVFYERYIINSK